MARKNKLNSKNFLQQEGRERGRCKQNNNNNKEECDTYSHERSCTYIQYVSVLEIALQVTQMPKMKFINHYSHVMNQKELYWAVFFNVSSSSSILSTIFRPLILLLAFPVSIQCLASPQLGKYYYTERTLFRNVSIQFPFIKTSV